MLFPWPQKDAVREMQSVLRSRTSRKALIVCHLLRTKSVTEPEEISVRGGNKYANVCKIRFCFSFLPSIVMQIFFFNL